MVKACDTCAARGYGDVMIEFIKDATQRSGWKVLDEGTNQVHFHRGQQAPRQQYYNNSSQTGTGTGANQVVKNKPCPDCSSSFAVVMIHWEQSTTEKYSAGHPKAGQFRWLLKNADGTMHQHGVQKNVIPTTEVAKQEQVEQQREVFVDPRAAKQWEETVKPALAAAAQPQTVENNNSLVPRLLVEIHDLHQKVDTLQKTINQLIPQSAIDMLPKEKLQEFVQAAENLKTVDQALAIKEAEQQQAIDELDEKFPTEFDDTTAEEDNDDPEEEEKFGTNT